jgi:phosphoserine phosphatase
MGDVIEFGCVVMEIVVSDVEGTLTTGSSWRALRRYFKAHYDPRVYNRFFLGWLPRYLLVKLGLFSRKKAMSLWMQDEIRLFRGITRAEFLQISEWVVVQEMWPQRRKSLISELDTFRQKGAKIVLSSSAYQPIVKVFAQQMAAEAVGSSLVYKHDKVWGVELPINSYEHKAVNIQHQYGTATILAAYGDTASDISMMELSRTPVAVLPDKRLQEVATARGWRVFEEEKV